MSEPGPCALPFLLSVVILVGGCHRSESSSASSPAALASRGEVAASGTDCLRLVQAGQIADALECYRDQAERSAHSANRQREYALALDAAGERRRGIEVHQDLIRRGEFNLEDLILAASANEPYQGAGWPVISTETDIATINSAYLALGAGHVERLRRNLVRARELVERALAVDSTLVGAHAEYGRVLALQADWSAVADWNRHLPEHAIEHPDIWLVRGQWMDALDERSAAARCYWEALDRDPNHGEACYRLGRILITSEDPLVLDAARQLDSRATQLREYDDTCRRVFMQGPNASRMLRAAELAHALDRPFEARGWAMAVLRVQPDNAASEQIVAELAPLIAESDTAMSRLPEAIAQLPQDEWPVPDWPIATGLDSSVGPLARTPSFNFASIAGDVGLEFQFEQPRLVSGISPAQSVSDDADGSMVYQVMGGGIGILDYDADGWPDVYFAQAATAPDQQGLRSDVVFRNCDGDRYCEVTSICGESDAECSQGVAVGDIDGDGFPDLFIGNIGRNTLLRNNGDGTFTNATSGAGIDTRQWTSSVAMADLTGDGLDDLYVVNYLEWGPPFDRVCHDQSGHPRTCQPQLFSGAMDEIWINAGNGRFVNSTVDSGLHLLPGRGLGVLIGDLDRQGVLEAFVANDEEANFLMKRVEQNRDSTLVLRNTASLAGVAFDAVGDAQACMGIAAGDVDGNETNDLFVTNFYNESNTLYLQQDGHVFVDASGDHGLQADSLKTLGFGCQFLDADLDGDLDLFVANGHLEDFSRQDTPYRMPPQMFVNDGRGHFQLAAAGSYFDGAYVGRAAATCDWNSDGRTDIVVADLEQPCALLENRTPGGHFLSLKLVGVSSAREAIGTRVRALSGGIWQERQLFAGDGFQCSNERRIHFGLATESIEKLEIHWPDGSLDSFESLPADSAYVAVQSAGRLYPQFPPISRKL